jgi:hypothetical protein
MKASWHHGIILFALALAVIGPPGPSQAQKQAGANIKPLLASRSAARFASREHSRKVNVWDYSKSKSVPVPGLFQFGEQVMRPQPYVHVGQQLKNHDADSPTRRA